MSAAASAGDDALYWLGARRFAAAFPPLSQALTEPNGLLALGGDLRPARLLEAYRSGIFPWYSVGQPILWWSPDPRAVLIPADVHVARSLAKTLRQGRFEVTFDSDFAGVVAACAAPRSYSADTWITREMAAAYRELHALGHAHSIECRRDGELLGGVYGVALGRVFFGESMFSRARDASKVALVSLCRLLARWGYQLFDCQMETEHLARFGAQALSRAEFASRLRALIEQAPAAPAWHATAGAP